MADPLVYGAAIMMGLFSAPHCLAMCGGLVSAFSMGVNRNNLWDRTALVLRLNSGRLVSYTALGLLGGLIGGLVATGLPQALVGLRFAAGLLLILCGFYIAGWWLGLRYFESFIGRLWKKLGSLSNLSARAGFVTGLTWGCLPCGLVYSALTIAMTQSSALSGGLFMLCFGLGTLPVLIGAGLMSATIAGWIKNTWFRSGCGALMVCYGVWTMYTPIGSV